jgi:hypothetical protein
MAAVGDAACSCKIGAVERGGPHLDQNFVRLGLRLRYVAQGQATFSSNTRSHRLALKLIDPLLLIPHRPPVLPVLNELQWKRKGEKPHPCHALARARRPMLNETSEVFG